jgi:putative glutamine amidotransferase
VTTPRIGITGRLAIIEGGERTGVNSAYLRSVIAAGGAPSIFSPLVPASDVPTLLDGVDGLILSGGTDIDPKHYGAAPHPKLGSIEAERDSFELALFADARARGLPVLAICRGLQLVNVALGGTLWQDLPSERGVHLQSARRTDRVHPVEVLPDTRLQDALGKALLEVNSFHHQAIRDLAPGLVVNARTSDGVIEGIEGEGDGWLIGVQWHPEEFWSDAGAPEAGLFRALVGATGVVRR